MRCCTCASNAAPGTPTPTPSLPRSIDLLHASIPDEKVLVFTQFADTVDYLTRQLKARGMTALESVTGDSDDPTALAWRFSPVSNEKREQVKPYEELRVLIATDVSREGQNLQDAHIVVNYDLPWAIIRLIQRAGRVDRIGQLSDTIHCYSFLPAEGVERIIRLRERVRERLRTERRGRRHRRSLFRGRDEYPLPVRSLQ